MISYVAVDISSQRIDFLEYPRIESVSVSTSREKETVEPFEPQQISVEHLFLLPRVRRVFLIEVITTFRGGRNSCARETLREPRTINAVVSLSRAPTEAQNAIGPPDDPGTRHVRPVHQDESDEKARRRFARDANEKMPLDVRHHVAR